MYMIVLHDIFDSCIVIHGCTDLNIMCASKGKGPQTVFNPVLRRNGSGFEVEGNRIPGMPVVTMQNATGNSYRRKKSKWRGPVPVSAIEKVLTQDNRYADMMLSKQLRRINSDESRANRLLHWQQQSFVVRQAIKETELRETHISHTSFLPEVTMKLTEPDVRARRPFGRVDRREADQLRGIDQMPTRSVTLPEITRISGRQKDDPATQHRRVLRRERTDVKDKFTRLHGLDLPLYGPERDAHRDRRNRKMIQHMVKHQEESKGSTDSRFLQLERTLTRDGRRFPETVWQQQKYKASQAADEDNDNERKKGSKSVEILRKMQEEMTSKPLSELAKSALVYDL